MADSDDTNSSGSQSQSNLPSPSTSDDDLDDLDDCTDEELELLLQLLEAANSGVEQQSSSTNRSQRVRQRPADSPLDLRGDLPPMALNLPSLPSNTSCSVTGSLPLSSLPLNELLSNYLPAISQWTLRDIAFDIPVVRDVVSEEDILRLRAMMRLYLEKVQSPASFQITANYAEGYGSYITAGAVTACNAGAVIFAGPARYQFQKYYPGTAFDLESVATRVCGYDPQRLRHLGKAVSGYPLIGGTLPDGLPHNPKRNPS